VRKQKQHPDLQDHFRLNFKIKIPFRLLNLNPYRLFRSKKSRSLQIQPLLLQPALPLPPPHPTPQLTSSLVLPLLLKASFGQRRLRLNVWLGCAPQLIGSRAVEPGCDGDECVMVEALMDQIGSGWESAGREEPEETFEFFDTDHDDKDNEMADAKLMGAIPPPATSTTAASLFFRQRRVSVFPGCLI
ncbi:hypothetical protein LINPERPRIM_LOCUS6829, partial [Linum perenne]